MDRRAHLLNNLRAFSTMRSLRRSPFFRECGAEIEALLRGAEIFANPAAHAPLRSFLRVIQWNLEKGKHYAEILNSLRSNEILRQADIILLNEADFGMNRSGNLHVARSLAQELGMNMAFGPAHLELTKETDDDLPAAGENRDSLQGNAILSRYPILEARVVRLPVCFEPYEFSEKRYGGRNCICVRLDTGRGALWAGCAHLEVRNTPRCRANQMKYLLENLPAKRGEPFLLGGDFNTNSFPRGNLLRTIRSILRLISTPPGQLKAELCHPERGKEPLFQVAFREGFFWQGMNSFDDTASTPIRGLEDSRFIPRILVEAVHRRLSQHQGYLHFKLDWLLGRDVHPLTRGEDADPETGVLSSDPGYVDLPRIGPGRISDHVPIYADVRV